MIGERQNLKENLAVKQLLQAALWGAVMPFGWHSLMQDLVGVVAQDKLCGLQMCMTVRGWLCLRWLLTLRYFLFV